MKTITFVRHGQSTANAGGVTMAHDAIPLTPLGHRQAQALAAALHIQPARILVSGYSRTHGTARPFCDKLGLVAQVEPLLNEFSTIDPALMQGMDGAQRRPLADAYWQAADPQQRLGAQAETYVEFDQRVGTFVRQLDGLPDQTVVFGHGMWMGLLVWKLLGFTSADSLAMQAFRGFQLGLPMPNCAVYRVQEAAPGVWRAQVDEGLLRVLSQVTD
jgi:broad specificity phosphatase PhoE